MTGGIQKLIICKETVPLQHLAHKAIEIGEYLCSVGSSWPVL